MSKIEFSKHIGDFAIYLVHNLTCFKICVSKMFQKNVSKFVSKFGCFKIGEVFQNFTFFGVNCCFSHETIFIMLAIYTIQIVRDFLRLRRLISEWWGNKEEGKVRMLVFYRNFALRVLKNAPLW